MAEETNSTVRDGRADEALVTAYAQRRDKVAFRVVVERHAGWVYAAAYRQLQDPGRAEDATQAVFVLLARRARQLTGREKLSGWLFTALRYTAQAMQRAERRRRIHERRAAALSEQEASGKSPPADELSRRLDEAVARLPGMERDAVILRFYQGKEFAAVAQGLGISEDAARKRVTRAVARLRERLGDQATALNITAAAIVGAHASMPALHAKVLSAAGAGAVSSSVGAAAKGAVYLMSMGKAKLVGGLALAALIVIVSGVVTWHWTFGRKTPDHAGAGASGATAGGEFTQSLGPDGALRIYHTVLPDTPSASVWSDTPVQVTKAGDRPYLGDFNPGVPVSLKLAGLPAHKAVRITFDLYLFRSWDGSTPEWGWALWDLSMGDGRNLIHTTFSNNGFFPWNNEQSFPDQYPGRPFPAWTGAKEQQSLGYIQPMGFPNPRNYDTSSVYHFSLTVPHEDSSVDFVFKSEMHKDKRKYFGLANVEVATLDNVIARPELEYERLWHELGNGDGTVAYQACWDLIASGEGATAYLENHWTESIDWSKADIVKRIRDMDDADPTKAQAAFWNVLGQGKNSIDPIDFALLSPDLSPKLRQWLMQTRDILGQYPESATDMRLDRLRHVLQVIHSPTALALAKRIPEHDWRAGEGKRIAWPWATQIVPPTETATTIEPSK